MNNSWKEWDLKFSCWNLKKVTSDDLKGLKLKYWTEQNQINVPVWWPISIDDQQRGRVGSVQPYLTPFGSVQPSLIVCRRRNVCRRSCGSRPFSTQTVSIFMIYVSDQTSGIYFSHSLTARLLARSLHCCWFCYAEHEACWLSQMLLCVYELQ